MSAAETRLGDDVPPPRANPRLLGHEAAERTLLDAFRAGRLAHAWLISGPRGIGKATLAFRFARFILAAGKQGGEDDGLFAGGGRGAAETAPGLDVDPRNPVFRRVASGGHADLVTVERAVDEKSGKLRTEIVVKDVREVGAFLNLTPAEGGWRVVVIDGAEDMNRNAASAVLKVLEEPPRRSLLLLVCHNPGRLLSTVRSRCRRLALKPLRESTVAELLRAYRPELAAAQIAELSGLSEGSIGRALTLAEEGGLDLFNELAALLESLPRLDVPALHALAERVGGTGAEQGFRASLDLLRRWLSRLIAVATGARQAEEVGMAGRESALIGRLAGLARLDRWLEVWEKVGTPIAGNDGADLDRRQVFLNAVLTIEDAVRP